MIRSAKVGRLKKLYDRKNFSVKSLYLHHIDTSTSYLNSPLEVKVYMKQLDGFLNEKYPGKVLPFKKAMYELKQSGR